MDTNLQINGFGPQGWSWRQLYEACTPLNDHSPYSLSVFKRNVKLLLELGPVNQALLDRAKTRPLVGSEREFVIYRIFHLASGMGYVGITDDWDTRQDCHRRAREVSPLHAAICEDGWSKSSFGVNLLVRGTITRTMARRVEKAFILAENTLAPNGFNQRQ